MTAPRSSTGWLSLLVGDGEPLFGDLVAADPLSFPGYAAQRERARAGSGAIESVSIARGAIGPHHVIAVAFDFGFLGGSMGVAAGERIAKAFERAADERLTVVAICASGGARMQEGMLALAQMPATIAARRRHAHSGAPFIAYCANPTTGGVYASFASLADLVWAEPGATIGFAGPRVAARVTGAPLAAGSHTAEEAVRRGAADDVVAPGELRDRLTLALDTIRGDERRPIAPGDEPARVRRSAWEQVALARDARRPSGAAFLERLGVLSIRRGGAPYGAGTLSAGFARIHGRAAVVVAQDRHTGDGRIRPADYRRARHAIDVAARLGLPVVTIVDTPGADPSAESEAGGIAREIALTFDAMLFAPVPVVTLVCGEGGSGGALALAAADRLLVQENAIFSVIAPEGAAEILGRDDLAQVASDLSLTAWDLREAGLADRLVAEPAGGAHLDPGRAIDEALAAVAWALDTAGGVTETRTTRWRKPAVRFVR